VFSIVSQMLSNLQAEPQPPQCPSSDEMSTHAPPQHRSAGTAPQEIPSAASRVTHAVPPHCATLQGSVLGHGGPETQFPEPSH